MAVQDPSTGFTNVVQQDPSTGELGSQGDGSYGIFFSVGDIAAGTTKVAIAAYAAGPLDSLGEVASSLSASVEASLAAEGLSGPIPYEYMQPEPLFAYLSEHDDSYPDLLCTESPLRVRGIFLDHAVGIVARGSDDASESPWGRRNVLYLSPRDTPDVVPGGCKTYAGGPPLSDELCGCRESKVAEACAAAAAGCGVCDGGPGDAEGFCPRVEEALAGEHYDRGYEGGYYYDEGPPSCIMDCFMDNMPAMEAAQAAEDRRGVLFVNVIRLRAPQLTSRNSKLRLVLFAATKN
jgi:hypothetical protein